VHHGGPVKSCAWKKRCWERKLRQWFFSFLYFSFLFFSPLSLCLSLPPSLPPSVPPFLPSFLKRTMLSVRLCRAAVVLGLEWTKRPLVGTLQVLAKHQRDPAPFYEFAIPWSSIKDLIATFFKTTWLNECYPSFQNSVYMLEHHKATCLQWLNS
jgi:hypothetical protein